MPCFIRWPGKIKAGTFLNGIINHQDMLPTFLAAAGDPDVKEKLLKGYKIGDKTFRVNIDGFNQLPYLSSHSPFKMAKPGGHTQNPRLGHFECSGDSRQLRVTARKGSGVPASHAPNAQCPSYDALVSRPIREENCGY